MTIFEANSISLSYEKNTVLNELSFAVSQGEYLCIVGENGSGKSTLMKALIGAHPVSSGTLVYRNGFFKTKIAYLAQQNRLQKDFPASVSEVILSGRLQTKRFLSFTNARDREVVGEIIDRLQLESVKNKSFSELSGGQKQRVLLARALASEAELLLVDEPTTGLDAHVTVELYKFLDELHCEGKTIVMVTHDISAAIKYATHILHLQNKPLFYGTRDEYLASDVGRGYIGT